MTHDINSIMLYIHPPIAIVGYIIIIISLFFLYGEIKKSKSEKWLKFTKLSLYASWIFNLVGLATGMLWAQIAWGSYWSWDPKENTTLVIFFMVCLSVLSYELSRKKIAMLILIFSLVAICINVLITLGNYGLHSYGLTP